MKKLSALLLALVLAATLCIGAMAEAVDYTGTWTMTLMTSGDVSLAPSDLGVDMTIVLNADGTATLTTMGMTETGSWAAAENGVALTDAAGTTDTLAYRDGTLVMASEGVEMIFTPGAAADAAATTGETEYAQILPNLTLADFAGSWELEHVETTFGVYDVAELGATMSVVITDADAVISMTTAEGTTTYNALCETEEATDLGTILWASFLDPTTGEPDGTGMMFLLYDDGQLVWYEYDSAEQCEYFYCFDKVTQ